ncbi:MAG: DUF4838 domain-containing protein [Clostridia bacterium]|nr:DUF4838 domain-containing protein [Clostridia bacterium]
MKKLLGVILSLLMICSFSLAIGCSNPTPAPEKLEANFKTDVAMTGYKVGDKINLENFIVKVDGATVLLKVKYDETTEEFSGENLTFTAKVVGEHTLTYTLTKGEEEASNQIKFTVSKIEPAILVANGQSQFKIVIPASPEKYDEFASTELQDLFEMATGYKLPIISDSELEEGGYYFSIGDTTLKESAGISVSTKKDSGYLIKMTDKVIYFVGNETENSVGTLFAVYKFLNIEFNYAYYAENVVGINKGVTDKKAYDVYDNFEYSPSLPGLAGKKTLGDEKGNLRYLVAQGFDVEGNPVRPALWPHNHLSVLPVGTYGVEHPDWYDENQLSLCLTNQEMMVEYANQMVKYLDDHPSVEIFCMGAMDRLDKCYCEDCVESDEKYTTTGTDLIFVNTVIEHMENTFMKRDGKIRDFKVMTLNYYHTEEPPVKWDAKKGEYVALVKADERVYPHVCFYKADCSSNVESNLNGSAAATFEGWKVVSDNFTSWLYQGYFDKYRLMFVDDLPYLKNWASKLVEMNSTFDIIQQSYVGIFKELNNFVTTQVFYDINVDVDELTADFMHNYYGIVGEDMLEVYNLLIKQIADYEKKNGNIYIDSWGNSAALYSKTLWTEEFLNDLQTRFEVMYQKLLDSDLTQAQRKEYEKRVGAIELFQRYWKLKFYGEKMDKELFAQQAEKVIQDAEKIYGYDTQYVKFDNLIKEIYTAEDFFDAMSVGFGTFKLMNDIDCTEYMTEHPWEGTHYINSFSGVLEGNNHKITGIKGRDDGQVAVYGFISEFIGTFNNVYMELKVEMPSWNGSNSFYGGSHSFGLLANYFAGKLNNCVFNIELNIRADGGGYTRPVNNAGLVAYACRGSEINNVLIIDSSTCSYAKYRTLISSRADISEYNITTNGVVYVRTSRPFGIAESVYDDGFACLLPDACVCPTIKDFYIANSLEDANTDGCGYTLRDFYYEASNKISNGRELWVAPDGKAMDALVGITYENGSVLLNGNVVYTKNK